MNLLILVSCGDDDAEGGGQILDDPLSPHAWHLNNTGQNSFALLGGTAGMDPHIHPVHTKGYSGRGVRIAVSDSGIETDHEDLYGNLLDGEHRNYHDKPWSRELEDKIGHGTSVAGLVGAVGGNDLGSYGVAYNARMAGFYFVGFSVTTSALINQAYGDFDIFNYSYGEYLCRYNSASDSYIEQLKHGVTYYREGKGAIYVKSGGNYYLSPLSDCDESLVVDSADIDDFYFGNSTLNAYHNWPYQIVVGALNAKGKRSSYSNPGSVLWVSAPGGEFGGINPAMVTTDLTGCDRGKSERSNNKKNF